MISRITNLIASIFVMALVCLPVVASAAGDDPLGLGTGVTPEGRWRAEDRTTRYDVTLCGDDGVSLCAKLVWIGPRTRTPENEVYLGKRIVDEIEHTRAAEWQGTISLFGTDLSGSVKMISLNQLQLNGCLLFICKTLTFDRVRYADGTRVEASLRN